MLLQKDPSLIVRAHFQHMTQFNPRFQSARVMGVVVVVVVVG